MPRRGEKGFTLIELLIVVAILGVLAAVVIPNVGKFMGKGEAEARRTEFHNVSSAVIAMMVDCGIATLPNPISNFANATNLMGDDPATTPDVEGFPDKTTTMAAKWKGTPAWAGSGGKVGYTLYQFDKPTTSTNYTTSNYLNMLKTKFYYTCDADGTVHQYDKAGGTEYRD